MSEECPHCQRAWPRGDRPDHAVIVSDVWRACMPPDRQAQFDNGEPVRHAGVWMQSNAAASAEHALAETPDP